MKRVLITLSLLAFSCLACAFEDPTLAVDASQYQQMIRDSYPQTGDSASALSKAERYARQELWDEAIADYEAAIAAGAPQTPAWLELSQAWQLRHKKKPDQRNPERARQAAYNAYRAARAADEKARALFLLGDLYDQKGEPKQAIAAFKEGLGLEDNPGIAQRYRKLVEANAFRVTGVNVESDSAAPKICLEFSDTLEKSRRIHYEDYLVINPAIKATISPRDRQLCLEGVSHGQSYEITLRPGVPSAAGEKTTAAQTFTATVDNRPPTLGFRGTAYILPKLGSQSLPLTSVNVNAARLKLLRINDRNLTQQINERRMSGTLDGYDIKTITEQSGEKLWEGELEIQGERNQDTTTAVPIGDILKTIQPGIYVLTAQPSSRDIEEYDNRASQWLVVSDLGLSTFKGEDGLHVLVRSLHSAKPLGGVELRLYARNNSALGQGITDQDGYLRFDPGLLRGEGGREPAALMAYGQGNDFNFLDLTRPVFDLSDRGVEGREAPGPVDAFLYSERGVYRPGETVELMVLARDDRGYALENLPLTLKVIRPDEVEIRTLALTQAALGGYPARIPLANNARTGTWTVRAYTDPKAKPVGQLRFQVEDFVPQRLKLELTPQAGILQPGTPVSVDIVGRFLYGAPAAGLKASAELVLQKDLNPYPEYPGYRFGLVQEDWETQRYPVDLVGLDAAGKAQTVIKLDQVPDTRQPLKATLRVSVFEPGGRPVNRSLALPYRVQPLAIGIHPRFEGDSVPMNQDIAFDVIALDRTGKPQAATGLRYELYREEHHYYWFYRSNRWDYERIVRDSEPVAGQGLSLSAEQPAVVTQRGLDWGNYRLEVFDPGSGAASSLRFEVGWFGGSPGDRDTPDRLRVTLDKPRYQAGETAKIAIRAPFAGQALVTVAGNRLWTRRTLDLPAEGAVVELPVAADWGPGVYITATAFRPGESGAQRGPGRAVGLTWLALDNAPRILQVSLNAPPEVRPRQSIELPVTMSGAEAGRPVWLTLAAVDEGILQLTDFATPDPIQYFLGKRRLGVELLDIYGKLIEAGGKPGTLRVGGDSGRQLEGSGVKTVKTVALFSGPVPFNDQGQARIPLTLPDFNGELRLMAVAWDASRLGRAEAPLLVRDPLATDVYLPRFLAPGDAARLTLEVQNLSAPAGDYRVRLTTEGAVSLKENADFTFAVADSAVQNAERKFYDLQGRGPGVGHIYLSVEGPQGFKLSRSWDIAVRPAQTLTTERYALRLEPGQGVSLNQALLENYLPAGARLDLSFSTRPNLDVPGLLKQLTRYPYGCVEQTTSTALPLLYFNQVAAAWEDGKAQDLGLRDRVQGAIQRILAMQHPDGAFGLWNPASAAELWLSAYVMDFLTRAREEKYLVPETAYRQTLEKLKESLNSDDVGDYALISRAYALYVLARADQALIGDLRYLHDNYLRRLPTPTARAQLGAALARYGEHHRAQEAFSAAIDLLQSKPQREWLRDYGTILRDQAALVTLLAESGVFPERLPQLAEELAAAQHGRRYTSTQEEAWLLLAAHALLKKPDELRLTIDGQPTPAGENPYYLSPDRPALERGINVANRGGGPIWYGVTVSGVPVRMLPPAQEGFSITRSFYTRAGQEVDSAQVKQNDLLVAVITGKALTSELHQALIVDLLPAGLEIENARLAHNESADTLRWLANLSETLHTEPRDDRFVAALDLTEGKREFKVAYLVRAVTAGEYWLPAVFVEDMYKPWYFGRAKMGKMKIE